MDEDSIPILNASLKDLNALARLERVCFSKADAWPLLELVGVLVAPKTVRLKMEVDTLNKRCVLLQGEILRKSGKGASAATKTAETKK